MKMTPAQLAAWCRQAAGRLPPAVRRAEQESLAEGVNLARQYSMGPYSLRMLARMGHPYARRRPRPPMHPGIINLQSGAFIGAWRVEMQQAQAGGLRTAAVNMADYSGFLDTGTRLMIRRPLVSLVRHNLQPARRRRLSAAIARALRG